MAATARSLLEMWPVDERANRDQCGAQRGGCRERQLLRPHTVTLELHAAAGSAVWSMRKNVLLGLLVELLLAALDPVLVEATHERIHPEVTGHDL